MTVEETLVMWRNEAHTRAVAQQWTATFIRTLHQILAYGAALFALVGSTTLVGTIAASEVSSGSGIAGFSSLIAAGLSGWLGVKDLGKAQQDHREAASEFAALQRRFEFCLARRNDGAPITDQAVEQLSDQLRSLDAKPWAAPGWIYWTAQKTATRRVSASVPSRPVA